MSTGESNARGRTDVLGHMRMIRDASSNLLSCRIQYFDFAVNIDDLIEAVTLLQCRFCHYSCVNKNLLMTHIKTSHREEVRDLVKQGKLSAALTPSLASKETSKTVAEPSFEPPPEVSLALRIFISSNSIQWTAAMVIVISN